MTSLLTVTAARLFLSGGLCAVLAFFLSFLKGFEKSRTAFEAGIGTQERRQSLPIFIVAYAAFARRLLKPTYAAANARALEKVTSLKKVVTVHFAVKREV